MSDRIDEATALAAAADANAYLAMDFARQSAILSGMITASIGAAIGALIRDDRVTAIEQLTVALDKQKMLGDLLDR